MVFAFFRRSAAWLVGRSTLVLLVSALLAVALIGGVGMSASVLVAERVQGSGSAINIAGSLRRYAHRAGAMVVATGLGGRIGAAEVEAALADFDATLVQADLLRVLERDEGSVANAIYRGIAVSWQSQLQPQLRELAAAYGSASPEAYDRLLAQVDDFVAQINTLVAVLEQDAEASLQRLRDILAAALLVSVMVVVLALLAIRRRVLRPLGELRAAAQRIAARDFSARIGAVGRDELGQVGAAFDAMADELSVAYRELEHGVEEKTADLTRSNRSLALLYHVIARLYHSPASAASYAETLRDIEEMLDLKGSFACMEPKHGGASAILVSNIPGCVEGADCARCRGKREPWSYQSGPLGDELMVPLRDAEHMYGMLRLVLPAGRRLEDWQRDLVEALSRHMGIALGITRQSERERLLALQEERSIIARELHDSLAQSLSYMKIQLSLLAPDVADPSRRAQAQARLADLREGLDSAYRQLRELLSSFRLHIDGDLSALLAATVEEFAARSGLPVALKVNLAGCELRPNQEVHVVHLVREALSNAVRHAGAARLGVSMTCLADGNVELAVEDDGAGFAPRGEAQPHHYGLAIMQERARGLGGALTIATPPGGGTRVSVRFDPHRPFTDNSLQELQANA